MQSLRDGVSVDAERGFRSVGNVKTRARDAAETLLRSLAPFVAMMQSAHPPQCDDNVELDIIVVMWSS